MFPEVKNVNVDSPKNGSKLLDFPRDGAEVMGAGLAERACVPAFLLSSRVGMTNLRMGMTNPRVGMTYPLSDSSLLLSRQSAQSCDKTTFASIFIA